MRLLARALLGLAIAACAACSSNWVDLSPLPPARYETLGPAEGEACATNPLALPWHQVLAFGAREGGARPRDAAIASVPGATGLVNVTLQDRWAYYLLFSRRCAVVRGDAIR